MSKFKNNLRQVLKIKIHAIEKARQEKATMLSQTIYLGTLGIVLILPIIIGAYLGVWLDSKLQGFSISWTMSLIIVGVVIGAINVYLLIKE